MTLLSDTEEITPNPTTMESDLDCEANGARNVSSKELVVNTVSFDSDVVEANEARSPSVPGKKRYKKYNANWDMDRRNSINAFMESKKIEDRFPLQENVYAFIIVAPIISIPFMFSCAIILLKFIVYVILWTDIEADDFDNERVKTTICKFLLLPVAIAMQEDLMDAYWFYANVKYCPKVRMTSTSATQYKMRFSYFLRTLDGLFSLAINIRVMLSTPTTLAVFLNFAALQFLQSIDDVFYDLVCLGFFGDAMEHMSVVCKKIKMIRRHGKDDTKEFSYFRISYLNSLLFLITLIVCLIFFTVNTIRSYSTLGDGDGAPTLSPTALNSWEMEFGI